MSADTFVDTNILIYAYDMDAGGKQTAASAVVRDLWESGKGILSTQVFQEFYVNVTSKIPTPIPPAKARGILENYFAWKVQVIQPGTILRAAEYQERHQLSFWDAMVLATAHEGNAVVLFTEDLNPGQIIEGIQIINPLL
jgi:predicted nucleic acid-binding protein